MGDFVLRYRAGVLLSDLCLRRDPRFDSRTCRVDTPAHIGHLSHCRWSPLTTLAAHPLVDPGLMGGGFLYLCQALLRGASALR